MYAYHSRSAITLETFRQIVALHGFTMKPQDEADYFAIIQGVEEGVNYVTNLSAYQEPSLAPTVDPSARNYSVPSPRENPLNAWSHRVRTDVGHGHRWCVCARCGC